MSTYFQTSSISIDKKNTSDNNGPYFELLSFSSNRLKVISLSNRVVQQVNSPSPLFFDCLLAAETTITIVQFAFTRQTYGTVCCFALHDSQIRFETDLSFDSHFDKRSVRNISSYNHRWLLTNWNNKQSLYQRPIPFNILSDLVIIIDGKANCHMHENACATKKESKGGAATMSSLIQRTLRYICSCFRFRTTER